MCRLSGVKVDKVHLRTVSRLKAAEWNELIEEFSKFATSLGLSGSKKKGRKGKIVEEQEVMETDGKLLETTTNK